MKNAERFSVRTTVAVLLLLLLLYALAAEMDRTSEQRMETGAAAAVEGQQCITAWGVEDQFVFAERICWVADEVPPLQPPGRGPDFEF